MKVEERISSYLEHLEEKDESDASTLALDDELLYRWAFKRTLILTRVDKCLEKHWFKASKGKSNLKVLAPMLSNSADIKWFAQSGHEIVLIHSSKKVI